MPEIDEATGTELENAPASEPTPEVVEPDEFAPDESIYDFLGDKEPEETPPAPVPPVDAPPAEIPAEIIPPATEPAPTEALAPIPSVETPATPATPAATPPTESVTPEHLATARQQAIEAAWPEMAPTMEEIERAYDPATAQEQFGRWSASWTANAIERSLQVMNQVIPSLVTRVIEGRQQNEAAKNKFYSDFPSLKGHEQMVEDVAGKYFSANPSMMGNPEAAKHIAEMTHALHNIPKGSGIVPVAPAQAAPQTRPMRPHTPTGAGVAPGAIAQTPMGWEPAADILNEPDD